MTSKFRNFEEWMNTGRNPQEIANLLTSDISNFDRMSHAHARQHHGPAMIQKAAAMGFHMTPVDVDHLLQFCLGIEVHIEPFDKKVYDYHL